MQLLQQVCSNISTLYSIYIFSPTPSLWSQGLETDTPELHLPDGTILVGEFEEIIGTHMVFSDDPLADEVKLRCHTDKKIKFTKKI